MSSTQSSTSSDASSLIPGSNSVLTNVLRLEKKRKAENEAVKDLKQALLNETPTRLRGKAQQL